MDTTTVTIRIEGTNLVVSIPEWDQLTVEHVYVGRPYVAVAQMEVTHADEGSN